MANFQPSIGSQIIGELKNVAQDVGQSLADVPRQILDSSLASQSGDQEGKALEAGQQVGDDTKAKTTAATSGQGWGAALNTQILGQQQQAQQRLTEVRRDLEQEMRVERQKQAQQTQQQQQAEAQQQQAKEQQQAQQQKQAHQPNRIQQMLSLGKGERRGAKGK